MSFLKKHSFIIYCIFFLLSICPFFSKRDITVNENIGNELFNAELVEVNSIDKAISYIDSVYVTEELPLFDTIKYIEIVSRFTKEKFYYGLSHYCLKDNWIAYLSGKLMWSHFSAIVTPNDIIKRPEALCSQQTIVFMELLKRKNIKVRSIGMGYIEGPGHFLAEVNYNGSWHLYDVTKEPVWGKLVNHHHESIAYYKQYPDSLFLAYDGIISRSLYDKIMEKVQYGEVNEFPAKKMILFHNITKMMTYLIPLFFGFLILFTLFKQKVPSKIIQKTASKLKNKEVELIE